MMAKILAIIAWVVIGGVGGLVVFAEMGPLFGIRHMEGGSAYFGLTVGAPIGIAAGVLFALWMLRKFKDDETKQKRFVGFSFLGIVTVVIGGVAFEKIQTRDHIHAGLGIQIRFPSGMTPPTERAGLKVELRIPDGTVKSINYYGAEIDPGNGRPYIYDSYDLYRAVPKRVVALRVGDGPTYLFTLRIDPRPKKMVVSFSDWYPVDQVDDNVPGKAPRAPLPDERLEIRHNVSGGE